MDEEKLIAVSFYQSAPKRVTSFKYIVTSNMAKV